MEIEPIVRISFNGNNQNNNTNNSNNNNNNNSSNINSTNKPSVKKPINQKMISNINNQKSPNPLNSSVDDNNNNNSNGTDEDIIKLARDLTNTFGILLGDSDQPSQFSDVIFKVGDRKFFASKIMLVARSEYFKAMFTGSMKESSIKEITLEGVDPDVFFTVLKYICIGILDLDYDHRMVSSIYQYCDLLGLQRGKELSLATMGKIAQMYLEKPDVESALFLWDSLNQSAIPVESVHPHLRAFVLQYASISLHCDAFYSISLTTLVQMLRNDGLRMEELDILDCVIDWCRENSQASIQQQQQQQQQQQLQSANGASGKSHGKRSSSSHLKKHDGDGGSDGSCSSRCSSRRNSLSLKDHHRQHIGNGGGGGGHYNNNDCHSDTEETYSDIDDEEHRNGGVGDDFENDSEDGDDDDEDEDEDDDFTDDDDKDDSANDDYEYSTNKDDLDIIEDWDTTIDKNLLDEVLPLIRWENMNIGEAFERLDNLKIIPDKEISNLLRHILKSNRGESFSFLGYHYRRPRNNRKRPYPIEFLLGITQPFDSNVTNEIIPLNSFSSEFGQSTNQFLYRIKKDIKLPANLERFSFKDREFFVQLKEREKGQLAVYLAFGSKLTKPLAISVLASVIGFRFQDSIEFSFKKMFDEGFDSAWGWPKFISLDTLYKQDKYSHYSDSFCLLIELTSQWG
ncbi:hypothetical protein ACTFIY_006137 [Dictyostelium cf. discoideum]